MPEPKLISFVVPCYNVEGYIDHCVQSILDATVEYRDKVEVLLVDDGSVKDDTPFKVDDWHAREPQVVRAIHQENGGHGAAVNTGLSQATGLYFKVVDADDWLDAAAGQELMRLIAGFAAGDDAPVDLIICNYVYEKVYEHKSTPIRYTGTLPEGCTFGWADVGRFGHSQNLLMHSVIYRTALLQSMGLKLPEHTFYVDNIFVYEPLPQVHTMYYLNADLYRYFIGREGQSVSEKTMVARIDQQLRITRIMIDAVDFAHAELEPHLRSYMLSYLEMMMTICSVFLLLSDRPDKLEEREAIWSYLEQHNPSVYSHMRHSVLGVGTNLPGAAGRALTKLGYKAAQKIYRFN